MDDVVCQIAARMLSAEIVLDTPEVIAFLDRRPVFKGHVLVCPRVHAFDLADLPPEVVEPLFSAVRTVASALPHALGCEGTFVAINNRVSQSVPHLHVHVVPRTKGDGLRGFMWPRTTYADAEMADYGSRIRTALVSWPADDPRPQTPNTARNPA
ncbi:MAG TPA: HIT family protein [Propionibacteriaceae bacterium]|nr:HIT family protein [Propionibacteriaceae bacterium]